MRHLLILLISILLLSSPVIGQSSKPLGVVLPPTVMGNVSSSRKQILLNTLDEEVSKYFDVSPPTNVSSGDLPVVSDVFQLQIVEEDGDTQLSVRWMSGNERKVETILCGGCKTIELHGKLEELVVKLSGGKKVEGVVQKKPIVVVDKRDSNYWGVLYGRSVKGVWSWYKSGNEKKVWKYVGQIEDGKPNGQGTLTTYIGHKWLGEYKDGYRNGLGWSTYPGGSFHVGEYKDGETHGQGKYTMFDGTVFVGEFFNGKRWNGTKYDENGNFSYKLVNGK